MREKPESEPGSSNPTPVTRGQSGRSTRGADVLATKKQAALKPVSCASQTTRIGVSVPAEGLDTNAVAPDGEARPRTTCAETVASEAMQKAENKARPVRRMNGSFRGRDDRGRTGPTAMDGRWD